jgi:hypothetical protein
MTTAEEVKKAEMEVMNCADADEKVAPLEKAKTDNKNVPAAEGGSQTHDRRHMTVVERRSPPSGASRSWPMPSRMWLPAKRGLDLDADKIMPKRRFRTPQPSPSPSGPMAVRVAAGTEDGQTPATWFPPASPPRRRNAVQRQCWATPLIATYDGNLR